MCTRWFTTRRLLMELVGNTRKIMSQLDDLKASTAKLATAVQAANDKLDADGASIKDLTAKLAALPVDDPGVADVTAQLNALADGLSAHVAPVQAAVQAATPA